MTLCIRKPKKTDGFTLIEMIISLAILVVVGGFVLQLFITAGNTAQKAYDLDKAVSHAVTAVEAFKGGSEPFALLNEAWAAGAQVQQDGGSMVNLIFYYDKDWRLLDAAQAEAAEERRDKAHFTLNTAIKPATGTDSKGKYAITVTVRKNSSYPLEKQQDREVYTLEAVKFFPGKGGVHP